jgi:hypothetical protein
MIFICKLSSIKYQALYYKIILISGHHWVKLQELNYELFFVSGYHQVRHWY